jgi:hypothetical protein
MWRQMAYLNHQFELINAGGVDDEQFREWLCQLQIADCLIRLDDVALLTQMRELQISPGQIIGQYGDAKWLGHFDGQRDQL